MSNAADDSPLTQADIDAALAAAGAAEAPAKEAPVSAAAPAPAETAEVQADASVGAAPATDTRVDAAGYPFDEAAAAMAAAIEQERGAAATTAPAPAAKPLDLPDLLNEKGSMESRNIELLRDVDLHVKIELGRSRMFVEDVLRLGQGSVVELDKLAGDPVDVLVNERLVARGEVLVLNDNFCVRINEILSTVEDVA